MVGHAGEVGADEHRLAVVTLAAPIGRVEVERGAGAGAVYCHAEVAAGDLAAKGGALQLQGPFKGKLNRHEGCKVYSLTLLRILLDVGAGAVRLSVAGAEPGVSGGTGVRITDRERPLTEANLKGFI